MHRYFDQGVVRQNTSCQKWDGLVAAFGTRDVLPMWVADMDFRPPTEVVEAVVERARHGIYGYPYKTDEYYEAAAGWMQRRHGWKIDQEWVVSTPGIVTAICLALQAYSNPGDKVIIQPPVYPAFARILRENDRQLVENPLIYDNGRYIMDFADLEIKAAGAKMLVLSNPHNPGGRVWTKAELARLAEICLRHGVIIISDEIHSDLVYPGYTHTPVAMVSPDIAAKTITCMAPSKTFNLAGLYASVIIVSDPDLRAKFRQAVNKVSVGDGNVFGIAALTAAYQYGDSWLAGLMQYLEGNIDYLIHYFNSNIPEIKAHKHESTFLAWLDCRKLGLAPEEMREFFTKKARVGLNAGLAFGEQGAGFMRLNFGCTRATLDEGLTRIRQAVNNRG